MTKIFVLLAVIMAMATPSYAVQTPWLNSNITGAIKPNYKPSLKDDFYLNVNREWITTTKLKPGYAGMSAFDELQDIIDARLKDIMTSPDVSGHDAEIVKRLYALWLDWQARNDEGISDLKEQAAKITGIKTLRELTEYFKTEDTIGDDKDRVLIRANGIPTYFASDIAYHRNKFITRGFERVIDVWGADHHGYIPRMKAAMTALGHDPDSLEVDIIQMVRLVRDGQEVKMSKRTGNALTVRELIDDIGRDAARYFFISRPVDTHMDLDLDFAKSQTQDNPVFYAQYAHARMCSILRQAPDLETPDSYELLSDPKEIELLKQLNDFPSTIASAAAGRQPNMICAFIQKLAANFHSFYGSCRVNDASAPALSAQRIALVKATRIVLKNALELIGIDAPEKM